MRERGSGRRPKNHKNIGFLINTGPDPLKITKLPSHHRHARETPFKWRFAGRTMMARSKWYRYVDHLSLINLKKRTQRWTPSEKPFWIRACQIEKQLDVVRGTPMKKLSGSVHDRTENWACTARNICKRINNTDVFRNIPKGIYSNTISKWPNI